MVVESGSAKRWEVGSIFDPPNEGKAIYKWHFSCQLGDYIRKWIYQEMDTRHLCKGSLRCGQIEDCPQSVVSIYSDLTRVFGPPKCSFLEGKWDPLFQGNLGW